MTHGVLPDSIRTARMRVGMSQATIARTLGINQSSVSDWERGQTTPSVANLQRLARILDVSVDALLSSEAA